MMPYRHLLLLVTTTMLAVIAAQAQTPPLPEGLTQQGGVIMMQPIADSDRPSDAEPAGPIEHREGTSHVLSPADHELYTKAFDAADRGDWQMARRLASQGHDAMASRLVQWRYLLDRNSGVSFAEIDTFLKANPDWPLRSTLQVRAEQAVDPATSPAAVIAWFGGRNPISGLGKIRLGDAMIAAGRLTQGRALVRQGWVEGSFQRDQELAIVQKDGAYFTPETDRDRLDSLLWRGDIDGAQRQMARVDDTTQRLAKARIALSMNPQKASKIVSELSADLASNPVLLFDRARAARIMGDDDEAEALLMRAPLKTLTKLHPSRVWPEINADARQALQDGKSRLAYDLVSDTDLTSDLPFAESQFMSGWIALRFLKEPHTALIHFKKLEDGVSRPISLARAHYWQGRAYEQLGDDADAWQQYRAAATDPETFYGQIALARIEAQPVLHIRSTAADDPPRSVFERDDLVRAMRVLADLGSQNFLRYFAERYQTLHPGAGAVRQLAQTVTDMGFRDVALRIAKMAGYDGIVLPSYAYPVIDIPRYRGPGNAPETALVLGLIRQETEFDAESISSAGARGLMQVMPSAARRNSRLAGLPYRPNKLISDIDYNMQLGMTEFSGYLDDWGNSLILAAAAYNAGPTNARKWLAAFGDPRSPNVDPIDWIEQIPFSETRNYVQRVIENTEVYRSRLAGHDQPLRILADLYGTNPPPKPLVYTPPPPAPQGSVPVPAPRPAETAPKTN
ncbi:MAG: lytic transglycosylase domain-containing protein [Alphaproteobacteria bacterium]|nr:lytic transglycosylase domain-containing protein [Alphaproteobacteria bacterium]MDE2112872.1 lytic transglycosylase domain-containing protein [Alphaproteobacteria bacterium]MDE2493179.1 lytic transglycosylase domain-containing protein [Alphaproteobacteria bacterium]